jgi:hypothetical protein
LPAEGIIEAVGFALNFLVVALEVTGEVALGGISGSTQDFELQVFTHTWDFNVVKELEGLCVGHTGGYPGFAEYQLFGTGPQIGDPHVLPIEVVAVRGTPRVWNPLKPLMVLEFEVIVPEGFLELNLVR